MNHIVTAIRTTLVLILLTGIVYPFAVWGIGQAAFPEKANGSFIEQGGQVVGSVLIGQPFTSDRHFHSRPSAVGYNAAGSGGSNLGPTSRKLRDRIAQDARVMSSADQRGSGQIPADAVTTSASGLDPHISPENAMRQVDRVARARGVDAARLRQLVEQHVEGRFLVFGEPRVNVLKLNLAVDDMMSRDVAQE